MVKTYGHTATTSPSFEKRYTSFCQNTQKFVRLLDCETLQIFLIMMGTSMYLCVLILQQFNSSVTAILVSKLITYTVQTA